MARAGESSEKARKRATRVSLRTLQRTPKFLAETADGEPIVEIESVRLVLPHGGSHFRHLVKCSRCGRESVGDPVMNGAQLRPPPLVFCDECTLSSIELPAPEVEARPAPAADPEVTPLRAPPAEPGSVTDFPKPPELGEGPGRRDEAPVLDVQQALEDLRDSVGRRLEEQGWVLERVLDEKLRRLVAGPLEEHRRVVEDVLTARMEQRQRDFVSQLAAALGERLEQHRQAVETLVREQLEQQPQHVGADLPSTLEDRLEQHRRTLEAIVRRLEQPPQPLVAELPPTLDDRLEQHRQALDASLVEKMERRHGQLVSQLAVALGDRLEQHRQSLQTAVEARLEQTGTVLTSELTAAVALVQEHSSKLITDLNDRLEERLGRLEDTGEDVVSRVEKALVELRDGQDERLALGVRVIAELGDRLRSQQKELAARLHTMGDRAVASGTLSLALVQASGEKVVASLAGLSAQLTRVSGEVSTAQLGLHELRSELGSVRSTVSRLASELADRSPAKLLAGFGVAAPGPGLPLDTAPGLGPDVLEEISSEDQAASAPVVSRRRGTAQRSSTARAVRPAASKKSATKRTAATRAQSGRGGVAKASVGKLAPAKSGAGKRAATRSSAGKAPTMRSVARKSTGTRKATSEKTGRKVGEATARLASARRALESSES